jgi:hypothetical protein
MVENTKNNAFAGAALLKTFMNGPQELSITDTANSISVALWTKLGGQQLPLESMDWLRVLRPAELALSLLEKTNFPRQGGSPDLYGNRQGSAPQSFPTQSQSRGAYHRRRSQRRIPNRLPP